MSIQEMILHFFESMAFIPFSILSLLVIAIIYSNMLNRAERDAKEILGTTAKKKMYKNPKTDRERVMAFFEGITDGTFEVKDLRGKESKTITVPHLSIDILWIDSPHKKGGRFLIRKDYRTILYFYYQPSTDEVVSINDKNSLFFSDIDQQSDLYTQPWSEEESHLLKRAVRTISHHIHEGGGKGNVTFEENAKQLEKMVNQKQQMPKVEPPLFIQGIWQDIKTCQMNLLQDDGDLSDIKDEANRLVAHAEEMVNRFKRLTPGNQDAERKDLHKTLEHVFVKLKEMEDKKNEYRLFEYKKKRTLVKELEIL